MIFKMEPLADAKVRGEAREIGGGAFGNSILPQQAHVKMSIVGRTLRLPVTRSCRPFFWQIVKRIPMNAFDAANEQFCRAFKPELLHLFGSETRDTNFGHP